MSEEPDYKGEEWVDVFMTLGRPAGNDNAFFDLPDDYVLFHNSGVVLTVGDVRRLQEYLIVQGFKREDRLTQLMSALPIGTKQ